MPRCVAIASGRLRLTVRDKTSEELSCRWSGRKSAPWIHARVCMPAAEPKASRSMVLACKNFALGARNRHLEVCCSESFSTLTWRARRDDQHVDTGQARGTVRSYGTPSKYTGPARRLHARRMCVRARGNLTTNSIDLNRRVTNP